MTLMKEFFGVGGEKSFCFCVAKIGEIIHFVLNKRKNLLCIITTCKNNNKQQSKLALWNLFENKELKFCQSQSMLNLICTFNLTSPNHIFLAMVMVTLLITGILQITHCYVIKFPSFKQASLHWFSLLFIYIYANHNYTKAYFFLLKTKWMMIVLAEPKLKRTKS